MEHRLVGKIYSGEELTWRSENILSDIKVGFCETCGFYHAYPYPSDEFLKDYYSEYQIICPFHTEERERFARLMLSRIETSASVIDIGCGKGELLATLLKYGFNNLYGTEFGSMLKEAKKLESVTILPYDIAELCDWCERKSKTFDCAILINVFEHVPEPIHLMTQIKKILSPEGIIVFCIPNDFNRLQMAYLEKTKSKPWFLILPDHLNFISLENIDGVLSKAGYSLVYKTVQYPLEFFLLQGDDYVATPELGKKCHKKRVVFENAFRETNREQDLELLYEGFAKLDIGRDMY
ncbi:MAG: class I SAM-dependent methyltransferase, partial [Actinobacteria bacterium]|nr:class I SAM-dependent methyltransferase [Actinomycetota bacterium]